MSSAATIAFDRDSTGVHGGEWSDFCAEHEIVHSPNTVGGTVYYFGGLAGVEVHYERMCIGFSTFFGGRACDGVARLVMIAWSRWGGRLTADPEIRSLIARRR